MGDQNGRPVDALKFSSFLDLGNAGAASSPFKKGFGVLNKAVVPIFVHHFSDIFQYDSDNSLNNHLHDELPLAFLKNNGEDIRGI